MSHLHLLTFIRVNLLEILCNKRDILNYRDMNFGHTEQRNLLLDSTSKQIQWVCGLIPQTVMLRWGVNISALWVTASFWTGLIQTALSSHRGNIHLLVWIADCAPGSLQFMMPLCVRGNETSSQTKKKKKNSSVLPAGSGLSCCLHHTPSFLSAVIK